MNWESIGKQIDDADEAAYRGNASIAFDIYHGLLDNQLPKTNEMQHYLFRRLGQAYMAIDENDMAQKCAESAFELSKSGADYAMVHYDIALSLIDRGQHVEAIERLVAAKEAYGYPIAGPSESPILRLIEDRIEECAYALETYRQNSVLDIPTAERSGESTEQLLAAYYRQVASSEPDIST